MTDLGLLFDLNNKIDDVIAKKGLDKIKLRGQIAFKSGVMLYFTEDTPDDPDKVAKIKAAAAEVLGEAI